MLSTSFETARYVEPEAVTALRDRVRVLVVDDDFTVRLAVHELLASHRFSVVTAADGTEALEVLGRARFSVIVTDLYMPGIDGIELIWKLHKEADGTPIIAVTGDSRAIAPSSSLLAVATLLGARAVLLKPFSNEQLLGAIAVATGTAVPFIAT